MIYLDNAATSFPKPPGMAEAIQNHMVSWGGNPGRSGHEMSRKTAAAIEETRQLLADFLGCADPSRIIFTQNATSALNLAIHGILKKGVHVITTSMEHNSVLRPIVASGADYTIVPCGSDGSLDPAVVDSAIRRNTRLIACTHASNVTGTMMPVGALVEICRRHNHSRQGHQKILLLVDASQTAGHIPINVDSRGSKLFDTGGIDLLAAAGHKGLLGPMGTGFLYVRPGLELAPLMQGGTGTYSKLLGPTLDFPESFETGTMNAPGIIGLRYSLRFLSDILDPARSSGYDWTLPKQLTLMLDEALRNINGITVYGPDAPDQKIGIVTFNIDGWDSRDVASLLNDNFGIATRAGFHCAGLAHKTIGTWDTGAVRMSLGLFNNVRQIKRAIDTVYNISKRHPGSPVPATSAGCRR